MRLAQGERVIKKYRQTKVILAGYFAVSAALVYLPYAFLNKYELWEYLGRLPYLWFIITAGYFLYHLELWFLNNTLVTSHRLLIISYYNLLHKQVRDLPNDKIVNIAYEKKGIAASLFDYGNIIIQQQSLAEPFVLRRLAHPALKKDEISAIIKRG